MSPDRNLLVSKTTVPAGPVTSDRSEDVAVLLGL